MRIILFLLFWIITLFSDLFGQTGIVLNYKLTGQSLGRAGIRGQVRALFQPKMKRITGSIYYQEAGSIFPNLDEKDIIIDFNRKMKNYYTSESRSWFTTPLAAEYTLINNNSINITSTKFKNSVKTIVYLNLQSSLGGSQVYTITFTYNDTKPDKVNIELKKYIRPTIADILSIFINNEKVIEEISKRSLIPKYGIPDTFTVIWQQKGKTKLNVNVALKTKAITLLQAAEFEAAE